MEDGKWTRMSKRTVEILEKIASFWKHDESTFDFEGMAYDIEEYIEEAEEQTRKDLIEEIKSKMPKDKSQTDYIDRETWIENYGFNQAIKEVMEILNNEQQVQ